MSEKEKLDNEDQIDMELTDISQLKCYTLPLSPQDLVAIYKDKGEDSEDEYILWVNYAESRLKLSPQHILIYLANTNFNTTFSAIDDDLLIEYIKTDFLVNAPLLSRILTNIIKTKYGHELAPLEKELYNIFDEERILNFIKNNGELLDEVVESIASVIPYSLVKLNENLSEENRAKEVELQETIAEIKAVNTKSNCGPNIAMMVKATWDVFLIITHYRGLSLEYNTNLYNDTPKYYGKDLFYVLNHSNVVNNILEFFPPGYFVTLEKEE